MSQEHIDISTKIYLGLPSDTTPDEEVLNGGFEDGSGGASNYAEGGTISYDGDDKIHTFTTANDGTGVFQVSNQITGARILRQAGGGGASSGGGSAGEHDEETGQTINVGNHDVTVGAGGTGRAIASADGDDGGDTTFYGKTVDGGIGGAKKDTNGDAGHNGAGGASAPGLTTTGGAGTNKNGSGNSGYDGYPYPAGGGAGDGGNAPAPAASDKGAHGGIGKKSDITGTEEEYAGGGGGGVQEYGFGGDGKYGGGDGRALGEADNTDAEDGTGSGGGGGNRINSGGDGANGKVVIRYTDAADYDFDDWTEVAGGGHVFVETSYVYAGSQSCKLTAGAYITQVLTTTPGNRYKLSFYTMGDGTDGITWSVADDDNGGYVSEEDSYETSYYSGGWTRTEYWFDAPSGCNSVTLKLMAGTGYGRVDAVSMLDYGTVVFTENTDWLSDPAPVFGGGIHGNEPDSCVAGSGQAIFYLDNKDGEYAPDNASCIDGFEEGMPVKIEVHSTDLTENTLVENGDFEDNTHNHPFMGDYYIELDDSANKYMTLGAYSPVGSDFSIEMMIRVTDGFDGTTNFPVIMYLNSGTTTGLIQVALNNNGANERIPYVALRDDSNNIVYPTYTGASLDENTWHHLAITVDRTNDECILYLDGVSSGAKDISALADNITIGAGGSYILGRAAANNVEFDAASLRIWGDERTEAEVQAGMARFVDHTSEGNLDRAYIFEDGSGATVTDEGADGSDGTLVGSPDWETFTADVIDGWTISNYAGVEDSQINDGSYAVKLASVNGKTSSIVQSFEVEPGKDYELIFYTKGQYYYSIDDEVGSAVTSTGSKAAYGSVTVEYIAEGATCTITLRPNAADDVCYFDDVSLISDETNYLRTKFYGFIEDIDPEAGKFDNPMTKVTCRDWMGYLNDQETGIHAIETSKTADYALGALVDDFLNQPAARLFDTGVETFTSIFKDMRAQDSMARAIYDLAWNEGGFIFTKGSGILVFQNSAARAAITDSAFTIGGTMTDLKAPYTVRNRYNAITLDMAREGTESGATTILWSVDDPIEIAANSTLIMRCYYTDPSNNQPVAATDVINPTADVDDKFGSVGDGSSDDKAADLTDTITPGQDSALVTIQNTSGAVGYLNVYNIRGNALRQYNRIVVESSDSDSQNKIGIRRFHKRLKLLDNPVTAYNRAVSIRNDYAATHIGGCKVTIAANQSVALARGLIEAEVSTRFTLQEDATGISHDFFVQRLQHRQKDTILWVTLEGIVIQ